MGCHVSSMKSKHHVKKTAAANELKRQYSGVSRLGNGNCEAARSEAGMSYELCIVHTVRARKGARWVGVLEYRVPPVLHRGGCPLGMQLCVCVLFPYPRISTKTSQTNGQCRFQFFFLSPPEGGLDLVTNRKGAIFIA